MKASRSGECPSHGRRGKRPREIATGDEMATTARPAVDFLFSLLFASCFSLSLSLSRASVWLLFAHPMAPLYFSTLSTTSQAAPPPSLSSRRWCVDWELPNGMRGEKPGLAGGVRMTRNKIFFFARTRSRRRGPQAVRLPQQSLPLLLLRERTSKRLDLSPFFLSFPFPFPFP